MSHTPGPWTYNQGAGTVSAFEGPTRRVICRYVDLANARLIAAAPELYEALKFVQEKCQLYGAADAARERIEAALKKAEGRA